MLVHPVGEPQTALQTSGLAQATRSVYNTLAAMPGKTNK